MLLFPCSGDDDKDIQHLPSADIWMRKWTMEEREENDDRRKRRKKKGERVKKKDEKGKRKEYCEREWKESGKE